MFNYLNINNTILVICEHVMIMMDDMKWRLEETRNERDPIIVFATRNVKNAVRNFKNATRYYTDMID